MVQNSATFARTADLRARQARRKELKRLLREVLPQKLPEVLIPKILTWVGYDLIEDKPIKPLRHSTRNRDPIYTGQKTIGGAPSKRSAPLVRVGTELRFELIARPERESDSESETIDPANQFSILGTS